MKRKKPANCAKDQKLSCYIDSPLADVLLSAVAHALWLPALPKLLALLHPGLCHSPRQFKPLNTASSVSVISVPFPFLYFQTG